MVGSDRRRRALRPWVRRRAIDRIRIRQHIPIPRDYYEARLEVDPNAAEWFRRDYEALVVDGSILPVVERREAAGGDSGGSAAGTPAATGPETTGPATTGPATSAPTAAPAGPIPATDGQLIDFGTSADGGDR